MFKSELIAGSGSNVYSLDLTEELPISLNYSIADVRYPDKRHGAMSKTIKLYGTKNNNKFFEHIYEVNTVTNTFNRNLKTPCYVIQDGTVVFNGSLRLLEVQKVLQNNTNDVTYYIQILGDNSNLFNELGDSKLEDLDLSAYNHTYNRVTQYNTWTATKGTGYVYPIIDYGYNAFATNLFRVEWLRPAIYVKQYLDTIFSTAGKTYTSSFFNTSFFKSLIIPHNGDKFLMSSSNRAAYEFYAGMSGSGAANNTTLTYVPSFVGWQSSWIGSTPTTTGYSVAGIWNDDTTTPFTDTGGNYNTGTGIISPTCPHGFYNIEVNLKTDIKFNSSDVNFFRTYNTPLGIRARLYRRLTSTSAWVNVDTKIVNLLSSVYFTTSYTQVNTPVTFANMEAWSGNQFMILVDLWHTANTGIELVTAGLTPISTGSTNSYDMRINANSTIKFSLAAADYIEGQTIALGDAIPKDVKQKDFLTSIIKMFNLYVSVDPNDENNYLIEPRDDYYAAGGSVDWSAKLDYSNTFRIKPMSEVDYKRFIYKYKDDSDYYNKKYQESQAEGYAQKTLDVQNDWTKNENKTEVIFSPTPVVDNSMNDLVIPKIFNYDGTTVKPVKHNIRILMFNGVVSNAVPYTYAALSSDILGAANLSLTSYGQAAMVDNTANPTVSIEFGVPNEVYYSPTTYTDNNLYNRYYSKFMNELTDRDSALVEAYFKLDPIDIATLDFRNVIYVRDCYYYLNQIMDYNPIKNDLTKVELLKLKNYSSFTPTITGVTNTETNIGNAGITARIAGLGDGETNVGNANNVLIGSSNRTTSQGSFVSGTGNVVGSDSYRITVVSCDNTVVGSAVSGCTITNSSGCIVSDKCYNVTLSNCKDVYVDPTVYNFVGINLSGVTITTADSGTVRMGASSSPLLSSATKTTSFVVDPAIQLYYIDCSGGNILATFNLTVTNGMVFYFKRIDNTANTFSVDDITGLALFDGQVTPYNAGMVQWDSLIVGNNGVDFFIL